MLSYAGFHIGDLVKDMKTNIPGIIYDIGSGLIYIKLDNDKHAMRFLNQIALISEKERIILNLSIKQ